MKKGKLVWYKCMYVVTNAELNSATVKWKTLTKGKLGNMIKLSNKHYNRNCSGCTECQGCVGV